MLITLTNANKSHKGKQITLNSEMIVSIHRGDAVRAADEDGNITEKEEVTFIFVPPHGTWEVEELLEDIIKKIN